MSLYRVKNNLDLSMKGSNTVASATSLLSEAVYYIDGTTGTNYIPTTASGYMYLPGVSGNHATTPDAAALDITGDIDIRVKVALDNWIPSTVQTLLSKWQTASTRSYNFYVDTSGNLVLAWTTGGSTIISRTSTVNTGLANGSTKWVRATLDVDNGSTEHVVEFYTSDNGTSWTNLGTAITTGGTTSIYSGSSQLSVGASVAGTAEFARGKFFQAQVLSGIAGTTQFNANFETAMTSQTVGSFTESSSNLATVTVNRTTYNFQLDTIANLGTAGSLLPTTVGSSTAADSNDPKFLDHTGTNYVYLPASTSNTLQVPDESALDITGDIDIRLQVALDDWTPGGLYQGFLDKWGTNGLRSYTFGIGGTIDTGKLVFTWTSDGTNATTKASSVATGLVDGTTKWIRVTFDVDNGASGNDIKFYTSDDGTTWTQLGTTVTTAGTTSIFASTSNLHIGRFSSAYGMDGKVFRAQVFNGIDGTKVLDVDTSVITAGSATSFTAVTGQTVTINRSTSGRKTVAVTQPTWLFGTDDYMEVNNRYMSSGTYLYLPGVASNYASTPDAAALDITGDLDLRVKVAMDDWTPSADQILVSKMVSSVNRSFALFLLNTGALILYWSVNGTNQIGEFSSVSLGLADGSTKWIRVTLDVDNGAGTPQYEVKFWTSDDGVTWTQLGTTKTGNTGPTSINNSSGALEIGSYFGGTTSLARGKFFRAQVYSGLDGTDLRFDANFETSITSLNQASFNESSTNNALVTINRSGSAYRSAGITAAGYLYPGATNTFSASATDFLNFGASDNFTLIAVSRKWHSTIGGFIGNKLGLANNAPGYSLYADGSIAIRYADGTNEGVRFGTYTAGSLIIPLAIRNTSADTVRLYNGNSEITSGGSATDPTTGSLASIRTTVRLGPATNDGSYLDGEVYAAAVFRRRLLAPEIAAIVSYFSARSA